MLSFNQFINESVLTKDQKEKELEKFNSIDVGDIVRHDGSRHTVTKVDQYIIYLPRKVSFNQWMQGAGKIIEKAKKKDEK